MKYNQINYNEFLQFGKIHECLVILIWYITNAKFIMCTKIMRYETCASLI